MKFLLLLIPLLLTFTTRAQTGEAASKIRRLQVENSLAPNVVFGDTVPKLNLHDQMAAHHTKGVSIAVIKDYKIDWANAYGWADEKENRPATTATRFQAASISKSINSLALLKLVQLGKINLDADINTYLRSWKFPYDSLSACKKISLANLLSHSAGLSVHGFAGYTPGDSIPTILQILNGQHPANSPAIRSLFEPSKKFQYSGGGTTISQLILTDVTGTRYEDFLKKEVLDPLGMTQSFFNQPPAPGTQNLATAYYADGREARGKYHIYPEQAAAGLWTTPTDLAKYIIETQRELEGRSSKVLSPAMMQKRLTAYIDSSVGLGVFLVKKPGDTYFNHNGGNEGFLSTYYGSFKGGNGVVVMINNDDFGIIPEIVNSVAIVYGWKDFYQPVFKKVTALPKESLANYVGTYLLKTDTLTIGFCGDQLCIRQNNQPVNGLTMVFSNPTQFTIKDLPDISVTILMDKDGKTEALEISEGNSPKTKAVKIK